MKTEQNSKLLEILFLRKILRTQKNLDYSKSFSKFGIGLVKYEICSNLKLNFQFKVLITVLYNSNVAKTYEIALEQFQEQSVEIQQTDSSFTQLEQINNQTVIISGGQNFNQSRFSIYSKNLKQEYQMQFKRFYHKTNFDRQNNVYIISGRQCERGVSLDVAECEIFKAKSKVFKLIKKIPTPVYTFGCDYTKQYIYVAGGFNCKQSVYQDKIQAYDCKLDS